MRLLTFTEFAGHFHPIIVHLPIGILLIALLLQWLSVKEKFRPLKQAVPVILLCGTISAAAACITGYLLSITDDYDERLVNWHMWMGIMVLLVSLLLYLKEINVRIVVPSAILSIILFFVVTLAGHLGGSLTHGSSYISRPLIDIFSNDTTENFTIQPLANVQEAQAFNQVVRPILQAKCFNCHNENKKKGGLRMDEINALLKGGKDGKVLEPGNPEESEMIKRLMLPVDDDKHMPPKEKSQPSESQIALLHWWISNGADFTKKVKELGQPDKIKPILSSLQQPIVPVRKETPEIPTADVDKANEKTLAALKARGIIILPVALNSNYLTANFVTDTIIDKDDFNALKQLKKQLVWLRLDNTTMRDELAGDLADLTALTRLNLSNTRISDSALRKFSTLENLQYLNLTGTGISAKGLQALKGLKKLKNLYLYRTNTSTTDFAALKNAFPATVIDSGGYRLESLPTDTMVVKDSR